MADLKQTGLYRPTDGKLIAGRYKITDPNPVGEGGMGVVYRGRDTRLKRDVAIKILHEKESRDEVVARFRQEAEVVNRIGHDGLTVVFDCAQPGETPIFIVMEFLDGGTLAQFLSDKDLRAKLSHPQHVRHVGLRMLDTLAAVHDKNIVHRDLKPENVFLIGPLTRKYRVKIIDFGIAKFMEADLHLTQDGSIMGTPLYMSPEQVQGLPVDNRTDLYAVGCLLYEMATGRPPFAGELIDVQRGHMHGMPEAPSNLNAEIPPAMSAVIMKALAKMPDARFPDAEAMAEALEDAVCEDPLFWRNSRPPSPVSGKTVAPRAPRLLPKEAPSCDGDDPAPTPTRLVPEEISVARSLDELGRAKTIFTPTAAANEAALKSHEVRAGKIPRGARWTLIITLTLGIVVTALTLILISGTNSGEADAQTEASRETTAEATKRDVILVPRPIFVPMPPTRDAEADEPEDAGTEAEVEAKAETEADSGTPDAEVSDSETEDADETAEAEVTDAPTPPAGYEAHLANGETAAKAENWREAATEFQAATEAWPEGATAWKELGNALLHLFQREEGEAAIRQYLTLDPNAADASYFRSLIGIEQ